MIQLYKLNEFQIKFRLKRMFIMLAFKRIKPMHSIINNRHVAFLFSHGWTMAAVILVTERWWQFQGSINRSKDSYALDIGLKMILFQK